MIYRQHARGQKSEKNFGIFLNEQTAEISFWEKDSIFLNKRFLI
jgi:hypothetical protein